MSTNPFRRSSLKGPSGSRSNTIPGDREDVPDAYDSPLSVNTKVSSTNQKHVNFASPPAVPISPVSYPPSSPESSRISPAFSIVSPVLPPPIDYSGAIQSDPFQAEAETDGDDGAIEQALQNARVNTGISTVDPVQKQAESVRNTLSKFSGAPRKMDVSNRQQTSTSSLPNRQTMDVDAFKRLLLTGDSGPQSAAPHGNPFPYHTPTSENDSSADLSSISQQSLTGRGTNVLDEDSDTSSSEDDGSDTGAILLQAAAEVPAEGKKPPPPPKSRHGKAIKPAVTANSAGGFQFAVSSTAVLRDAVEPNIPSRQVPAPPLARRKSQRSGVSPSQARIEQEPSPPSTGNAARAPPPPPTRRPISMIERRPSSDMAYTAEEPKSSNMTASSDRRISEIKPLPPPARNSSASKRMSMGTMSPPPPPPPRRGRASSRSSIDSQRPSLSSLSRNPASTRSSGEYSRPEMDSRKASAGSNANDILADLAALQREVDEARRRAGD